MACGPLTLRNLQGSWGHGPVREYGLAAVFLIVRLLALSSSPRLRRAGLVPAATPLNGVGRAALCSLVTRSVTASVVDVDLRHLPRELITAAACAVPACLSMQLMR